MTPAEIAKAFTIAREVLDARSAWGEIDALDGELPESAQLEAISSIWSVLRVMTRWLLQKPGRLGEIAAEVARYLPGMIEMRAMLSRTLVGEDKDTFAEARAYWLDRGAPQNLSERLSLLPFLSQALDIIEVALQQNRPLLEVAGVYSKLGHALHTRWLLQRIEELPVEGRWQALARGTLRDEMQAQQALLVSQLLRASGDKLDRVVETWVASDLPALRHTMLMFNEIRGQRSVDYPTVQVAVRRLAQLALENASAQ